MMGKARHLVTLVVTVVTMGQGDTQYLSSRYGIFTIGLIEVTTTKQQHSIRMLCLQVEKLLHHWGEFPIFLCHYP